MSPYRKRHQHLTPDTRDPLSRHLATQTSASTAVVMA